jgi:hypothetical protein
VFAGFKKSSRGHLKDPLFLLENPSSMLTASASFGDKKWEEGIQRIDLFYLNASATLGQNVFLMSQ